jgi:hypothetical protein
MLYVMCFDACTHSLTHSLTSEYPRELLSRSAVGEVARHFQHALFQEVLRGAGEGAPGLLPVQAGGHVCVCVCVCMCVYVNTSVCMCMCVCVNASVCGCVEYLDR